MTDKKNPKTRRCDSCVLFCDADGDCPANGKSAAGAAACTTHFEPNDTCRIADALETLASCRGFEGPGRLPVFCVKSEAGAAPDLSRLEQELRALATSAGAYRGMGDYAMADQCSGKADVIRRCIAILKGEQEPLEMPK